MVLRFVGVLALLALGCSEAPPSPDASPADASDLGPDLAPDTRPAEDTSPQDGPRDSAVDSARDAPAVRCEPLRIEPAMVRIATEAGTRLTTTGGSGTGALFAFAPGAVTQGSTLGVGGGLVAGTRAASFEVLATDLPCSLTARARVEVVGPFVVEPDELRVAPGRTVRFTARGNLGTVRWDLLMAPPRGDGRLDASGSFTSGTVQGAYRLRATDTGSGREVQLRAEVAAGDNFAPLHAVVLVPSGQRAPLRWRGGSGTVDAAVTTDRTGGAIERDGDALYFNAAGARAGTSVVTGTDRFTMERDTLRVVVGDEVSPAPIPRGPQNLFGDVVFGDINRDGRQDLIFGQANRSRTNMESGGVLVFLARADGTFVERPDQTLEGVRDLDHFGSLLLTDDVDGDGTTDLVLSSADQDLGRDGRGAVGVYLGSPSGLVTPAERVFSGENGNDRYGTSVLVADLDRDGVKDLLVAAPNATNPFAPMTCRNTGKVYVYHGLRATRGLFETVPVQVLDVRDRLTDTDGPPECRAAADAGRAMVLVDMDNDGRDDLVLGAPLSGTGSVLVYRGDNRGRFTPTPSWVIHLDPMNRPANARFGFGLDVVTVAMGRRVLVVRSPTFAQNLAGMAAAQTGGLWVFPPGTLGAVPREGTLNVVLSSRASLRYVGATNAGFGRSAVVTDLDGDGVGEYLVGGAGDSAPNGALWVFSTASLAAMGTLMPTATITGENLEFLGARSAAAAGAMGRTGPVAVWAAYRNTPMGFASGALVVLPPGSPSPFMTRWMARSTINLPLFANGDRSGAGLALGPMRAPASGDLVLGSPGAHSPEVPALGMTAARPAGFRARVGVVDVVRSPERVSFARFWQDRGSQLGGSVAMLDFNGDGRQDVAIGDPGAASGGTDQVTSRVLANTPTDPCFLRVGTAVATASPGRGVVHVYLQQPDGTLAERFWLIPRERVPMGGTARRLGFGATIARAGDVNGDGMEDLLVGRPGGAANNGAEVVLGRAPDTMGRLLAHCADPDTSPWWPERADNTVFGVAVTSAGDLDGDGCSDTAVSVSGNTGGSVRAGLAVQFGFGTRCGMHTAPFEVFVVPDDRFLRDNTMDAMTRANDFNDLPGATTNMGLVLTGGADVTGDRVPDLVFRDTSLAWRTTVGPAVEVLSGAVLTRVCPDRRCTDGLRENVYVQGDYIAVGLRTLEAPERRVIPSPDPTSARYGSCLAVADLDGDNTAEVLVGGGDLSRAGPFAGALLGWRGGSSQDVLAGEPWLLAVGDAREPSLFGTVCAARAVPSASGGGAWVAVGAPSSNHRGAQTGAAYRWRIEP
ncbi:MAG: FG-GAP repeat protein [Deltaproteobacteria bacterium]|nr:FG-GAP repeat protein [Deltaproteobacteria bacterium]